MNAKVDSCYISIWSNAYSIGDEKIDAEHQRLFDIANELNVCTNKIHLTTILKELIKYTKFHFANEERFMRELNFSRIAEHKVLHQNLVEALNEVLKKISTQDMEETIFQLSILVNKNILQHILIEDKKVHHEIKPREHLRERFKWNIEYQLKNQLLDEEHEQLFNIALKSLNYHGTNIKTHVKITVNELYEYMKTHFNHEEEYLVQIGYPLLEEHRAIHENIIEQMNAFIKKLPTLSIINFEKKLIEYMDIWLINHILYEDRKIISFVQSNQS